MPQQFRSGHGGYVEVSTDGTTWTQLDLALWELDRMRRLGENTNSASGGGTGYTPVVGDPTWRLEIPWDENAQPDTALHLVDADVIYLRFKHGSGNVKKTLSKTTVENFRTVCDNKGDIVRVEGNGKGGVVS